ncbi:CPBP family intramembrane glutamic endopeptidase [Alkalicoccus halolimnae]|uniref:CPBP family intramembrane glutamic endopeptidase n=1 Tax=Alkalicoccus halolimnae TaxID=1667239 RepID=A0A5C7FEJ2_9BACI|nr:CPBP family intramembrane glutamic endopeptidase [Alkalicoccus halolimnae]TXF83991.1 CPBP family intramembrane metalloprotease [Alkalicoccus halolimnae]
MKKRIFSYIIIAFSWTWACWIGAFFLSRQQNHALDTEVIVFDLFRYFSLEEGMLPQLLFAAGVYGPLLGYLFNRGRFERWSPVKGVARYVWMAALFPVVLIIPVLLLSLIFTAGAAPGPGFVQASGLIGLYFIANFLTSGTEEFGWRGVLYPYFREKGASFWESAWKSGVIWAVWHYPLLVILYAEAGMFVLLPSLIGFTASIVAMNYITNFIFEKTVSIPLVMVLHALNNTGSFAVLLFFPETPFIFISSITAWVIVAVLEKKYRLE